MDQRLLFCFHEFLCCTISEGFLSPSSVYHGIAQQIDPPSITTGTQPPIPATINLGSTPVSEPYSGSCSPPSSYQQLLILGCVLFSPPAFTSVGLSFIFSTAVPSSRVTNCWTLFPSSVGRFRLFFSLDLFNVQDQWRLSRSILDAALL